MSTVLHEMPVFPPSMCKSLQGHGAAEPAIRREINHWGTSFRLANGRNWGQEQPMDVQACWVEQIAACKTAIWMEGEVYLKNSSLMRIQPPEHISSKRVRNKVEKWLAKYQRSHEWQCNALFDCRWDLVTWSFVEHPLTCSWLNCSSITDGQWQWRGRGWSLFDGLGKQATAVFNRLHFTPLREEK